MYYYSAHDSSITAFLVALNLTESKNNGWPPFAADIIIELWKNDDGYFLRVFYCDDVSI
jgi:hypothetical protein